MTTKTISMGAYALLWVCLSLARAHAALEPIDHRIDVRLNPAEQSLQVSDYIQLRQSGSFEFSLHAGLQPGSPTPGVTLQLIELEPGGVPIETYRVSLPPGQTSFQLEYAGRIAHQMQTLRESRGRQRQLLSGTISAQGVFLNAATAWYPRFAERLQTYTLDAWLPLDWYAVSQGQGPDVKHSGSNRLVSWTAATPQDDIYLIAGPFHFYSRPGEHAQAQVFLREDDAKLAESYLQVTERYLQLYSEMIGPYPYAKFALVENFWETGYGMPSFTLLGSRVLRLPFILHSSYPHEILHNWWGNSVYVDYSEGNWSEGLTSYLADHLLKEQRGQGINHRRSALQRYANFVREQNDFALRDFRARHSTSSQAVGYDKSLMMFHMLRRQLGDDKFIQGLRQFYREQVFQTAGFSELQQAFEQVSKQDLSGFFEQWLQRKGAPALKLESFDLQLQPTGGYRLDLNLAQAQTDAPFALQVPLLVYLEGAPAVQQITLDMQQRQQSFSLDLEQKPLRVDIDPWFDLFRQLDPDETPPTLGEMFGSKHILYLLPSAAPAAELEAYRALVQRWSAGDSGVSVRLDNELDSLPGDVDIWLLGWQNRFLPYLQQQLDSRQFSSDSQNRQLAGQSFDPQQHSLVAVTRDADTAQSIAWLGSHNEKSIGRLAAKLPHYGRYSYLLFAGDNAINQLKGQWNVTESPMKIRLTDQAAEISEVSPPALWK